MLAPQEKNKTIKESSNRVSSRRETAIKVIILISSTTESAITKSQTRTVSPTTRKQVPETETPITRTMATVATVTRAEAAPTWARLSVESPECAACAA